MMFPRSSSKLQAILTTSIGCAMVLGSVIGLTPNASAVEENSPSISTMEDGTYLFGESSQTNEVGKGYVVFSKQGQRVVGALYYPQSEFSCFVGNISGKRLDVTAFGPYDQQSAYVEVPLTAMHKFQTIGTSENKSLTDCHQEIAEIENRQPTALQRNSEFGIRNSELGTF